MKFISTPNVPASGGHYSQAVESGGFVFVFDIFPGAKAQGTFIDCFENQVRDVLQHCERVLAAVKCRLDDVVQCTAYIVGVDHWPAFNRIYSEYFGSHRPAHAVVPVPELYYGFLVEIKMIAARCTG